jgi:hypothetical protein
MDQQRFRFLHTGAVHDAVMIGVDGRAHRFRQIWMSRQYQQCSHLHDKCHSRTDPTAGSWTDLDPLPGIALRVLGCVLWVMSRSQKRFRVQPRDTRPTETDPFFRPSGLVAIRRLPPAREGLVPNPATPFRSSIGPAFGQPNLTWKDSIFFEGPDSIAESTD